MNHIFRILTAALVVAMGMGMGFSGIVAAADTTTATPTPTTTTTANTTTEQGGVNININTGEASTSTPTPTPTPTPAANGTGPVDRIDQHTLLMKKSYFENDAGTGGTAVLVIKSDRYQQISVTDAMGMSKAQGDRGADINHHREWIDVGDTTRIEIEITESDNWAGVIIGTDSKLRGYEMSEGGGVSPLQRTTSTAGWLGGAGVAVAMFGAAAYQRRNKEWPAVEEAN